MGSQHVRARKDDHPIPGGGSQGANTPCTAYRSLGPEETRPSGRHDGDLELSELEHCPAAILGRAPGVMAFREVAAEHAPPAAVEAVVAQVAVKASGRSMTVAGS